RGSAASPGRECVHQEIYAAPVSGPRAESAALCGARGAIHQMNRTAIGWHECRGMVSFTAFFRFVVRQIPPAEAGGLFTSYLQEQPERAANTASGSWRIVHILPRVWRAFRLDMND